MYSGLDREGMSQNEETQICLLKYLPEKNRDLSEHQGEVKTP